MTDPKEGSRAVDVPSPCPAATPVRTGGRVEPEEAECRCPSGHICSVGTIPMPEGATLLEVRAFVYHSEPNPVPESPPDGAVSYLPPVPPEDDFVFDHNHDNEIPGVRCGNGNPRDDNWLVIWARWLAKDEKDESKETWQFSQVVRVCGVCGSQTECEMS